MVWRGFLGGMEEGYEEYWLGRAALGVPPQPGGMVAVPAIRGPAQGAWGPRAYPGDEAAATARWMPAAPPPPPPTGAQRESRTWLSAAEEVAAAGRAWVALAGDLVGLAFKLMVFGAVAWGLWVGLGAMAAGRAALATEEGARSTGRTLDAFLSALSAPALTARAGGWRPESARRRLRCPRCRRPGRAWVSWKTVWVVGPTALRAAAAWLGARPSSTGSS